MSRLRYWKLGAEEVAKFRYPEEKLLNWDMKCIREPEEDAAFVGVFLYKHGAPLEYATIKGIVYYHNNISRDELPAITKFLKNRYGGEEFEKGERIFLKNSKEIYSGKDISALAKEMESNFDTRATITLEFQGLDEDDAKDMGLPEAKLLPIVGK